MVSVIAKIGGVKNIGRSEDMRLINADKLKKELLENEWDDGAIHDILDASPIVNAIPIPDNATNGDMIEAMFPNLKGREKAFEINVTVNKNPIGGFAVDWWNAPYGKERGI